MRSPMPCPWPATSSIMPAALFWPCSRPRPPRRRSCAGSCGSAPARVVLRRSAWPGASRPCSTAATIWPSPTCAPSPTRRCATAAGSAAKRTGRASPLARPTTGGRPNKLRYAKRLAAALGAVALLHHDTVRLCAIGDGLATLGAPLHGYRALSTVVEELEELPIATTTELRRGVEAYRRVCDHRGIVMLIGDLLVPADQDEALSYLDGAGVTAAVLHIVDAAE